jgi:hypothetical protein
MTFKPAHIASATVLGIALSLGATPALAANKDMIQSSSPPTPSIA